MNEKDKELLLKDLSARLPYGVVYHRNDGANIKLNAIDVERGSLNYTDDIEERECKPYLLPISSMTEEEYYGEYHQKVVKIVRDAEETLHWCDTIKSIDWLPSKHFGIRGPKGLIIEVTENNNPYKKN